MVCVLVLAFVMLISKPTERASMTREVVYVVREIKVLEISGKAPYNTSLVQGQLGHDDVQDNAEEKRRQRTSLPYFCVCVERPVILPLSSTARAEFK